MSLDSFLSSFDIGGLVPSLNCGETLSLSALPDPKQTLPVGEAIMAPIDLALEVRHLQLLLEQAQVAWPNDAVPTLLTNLSSGLAKATDAGRTEGWVSKLVGQIPIGSVPIELRYRWNISLIDGDVVWAVPIIAGDLASPEITIAVPPLFREASAADFADAVKALADMVVREPGALPQLSVSFSVEAWVASTRRGGFTTPEVKIPIVPLPSVTVAALCQDTGFRGACMVMLPETSVLGESPEELGNFVAGLKDKVAALRSAAAVAGWLLGIDSITGAIDGLTLGLAADHLAVRKRNYYSDLSDDEFIVRDWWDDDDIEDYGSSALLISPARTISYFQHDSFGGKQMTLDARPDGSPEKLGAMFMLDLHAAMPATAPPGCLRTTGAPGNNWGDRISSYSWTRAIPR